MTVSDSLPIQFWPVASETFNEKEICSVTAPKCYCMPIKSDQAFVLRITADSTPQLRIYSDSGSLLHSQNFTNISGDIYQITLQINTVIADSFRKTQQIRMSIFESSAEVYKSDCLSLYNCGGYEYTITLQNQSDTSGALWAAGFWGNSVQGTATGTYTDNVEFDGTTSIQCDIQKLSNGGIAQGDGSAIFKKNGSTVNTVNFLSGDDVFSGISYTFTSVTSGDILLVQITGDGIPV
jgi:hypothetical protein